MKKKRHSLEAIMRILREAKSETVSSVCHRHGLSEQTLYRWRRKYAGMEMADAKRLKALEEANRRLKALVGRPGSEPSGADGSELKKMVGPEHKRRAVSGVLKAGLGSMRRACHYLGLGRSNYFSGSLRAQAGGPDQGSFARRADLRLQVRNGTAAAGGLAGQPQEGAKDPPCGGPGDGAATQEASAGRGIVRARGSKLRRVQTMSGVGTSSSTPPKRARRSRSSAWSMRAAGFASI
jgi:putative transposase